jgi:PRC-barrel domain
MIRTLSLAAVLASALALSAIAQDTKTKIEPSATTAATSAQQGATLALTEEEGKTWIDKPIYSSDGQKIGEVVAFQRDAANNVIGLHADVGGFLGIGQTRINLTPPQFKLQGDRVVLELTAAQAKELPKVQI